MAAFDSSHIKISPGTLYIAPLGSTEPTSVTGAWPAAWVELGYTDTGSTFQFGPTTANVTVEEEFYPVEEAIVTYTGKVTFVLAETTRRNLAIAMNTGVPGSAVFPSDTQGGDGLGTLYQDPPDPGEENRVMIGWDSLQKGVTTGTDPFARFICRKTLQVGQVTRIARKGNNKAMYSCDFSIIKPPGTGTTARPFRFFFPAYLDN